MNKVVLEHYPAARLPKDLRGSIATNASVRVTVEEEPVSSDRDELLKLLDEARRGAKGVSTDDAVRRIRELRDEWDD